MVSYNTEGKQANGIRKQEPKECGGSLILDGQTFSKYMGSVASLAQEKFE